MLGPITDQPMCTCRAFDIEQRLRLSLSLSVFFATADQLFNTHLRKKTNKTVGLAPASSTAIWDARIIPPGSSFIKVYIMAASPFYYNSKL